MTNEEVYYPECIDTMQQVLIFEADDLMPIFLGLAAAAIINMQVRSPMLYIFGLLGGILMSVLYIRLKRNALPGAFIHLIYLCGLPLNKVFNNGLLRRVED
ncbi:type IV conjugative transfer system protein TraL [Neisseria sp. S1]|uniref:type IV conjugative transfer system protein TraL n=1 Tax=Neisseria sp. S1 TaxID=3318354 RepID=UPI003A872153